jgi:hypothetical protein
MTFGNFQKALFSAGTTLSSSSRIMISVHFLVANVTISYSVHETETNKNNGKNKILMVGNKSLKYLFNLEFRM